jgi:hypothetical protein
MPRGVTRARLSEVQTTLLLDVRTKSAFGADQNDLDLTVGAMFCLSTSGGPRTITGIAGGVDGREIELVNVGTDNIFLQNEGTNSAASNRIKTGLASGGSFTLAPGQSVWLSYSGTLGRWVVNQFTMTFDPELDSPLQLMLGGVRNIKRSGGAVQQGTGLQNLVSGLSGYLKVAQTIYTGGNISSQAFGPVTSIRASFTLPKAGFCIVVVCATHDHTVVESTNVSWNWGARFDSDSAQEIGNAGAGVGSGGDFWATFPFCGFWGKSLAAGAHTADLCWGNSSGQSAVLLANSTTPASIMVLYPG